LGQDCCRCAGKIGLCADNHINAPRQLIDPAPHERAQDTFGPVADHRVAHGFGDDKTDPRRLTRTHVGLVGMKHEEAAA